MNYISVGDMSQAFQMQRHNAQLKTHLSRLTQELTTGVQLDLGAAVRGDFTALAGIDRSLATLGSYAFANDEVAQMAATMQTALDTIQSMVSQAGPTLLSAATSSSPTMVSATSGDARQKFAATIMALNTNTAGRYAFSGDATDTPPLASADDILAALGVAITGETGAVDVVGVVDAWFDAPAGGGGYLDLAYRGGTPMPGFRTGEGELAELTMTAADPDLRDALKGLAIAALVSDGALMGDDSERARLTRIAGERVVTADGALALLRARIGITEGQIASSAARNAAETSALMIARSGMITADPYDTATALEAVQTQIETLYTLTARLSRLSFADYMT